MTNTLADTTASVSAGLQSPASAGHRASPAHQRAAPPRPAATSPAGRLRLAWLDALRGIAALCVVYAHFGARVLPWLHVAIYNMFDPGLYGVLVFFLISGYIVPASLERKGSLRGFWISRVFRLFPLFAVVIGLTVVMQLAGLASLPVQDVTASALSHLFMLNDLLGADNVIVVIWTLSYEMVFYVLLTALFTAGWHRRSGGLAGLFAAGALLLGGLLPAGWLSYHTFGLTAVALTSDVLVIGGLIAAVTMRGRARALGAWVAAATALLLVLFNGRRFGYEGLAILALMFTGTLIYRAQHGQLSRNRAAAVVIGVFAAVIAAGVWHIPVLTGSADPAVQQREWVMSFALAGVTFGAGLALQRLRVPPVLAWLGLISYSVYLIFPLLLDLYDSISFPAAYQHQALAQAGAAVVFLTVLLGCAATAHRLVEVPMQQLGRRATAWLDGRALRSATARRPVPSLAPRAGQA